MANLRSVGNVPLDSAALTRSAITGAITMKESYPTRSHVCVVHTSRNKVSYEHCIVGYCVEFGNLHAEIYF